MVRYLWYSYWNTKILTYNLKIEKDKKIIEIIYKKFNEVNNNYQKNIIIINEWKDLFYKQLDYTKELKEKFYKSKWLHLIYQIVLYINLSHHL